MTATMQESDVATTERSPLPRPGPLAFVLLLPIHLYRKTIGPLLPPSCRFYPTCSTYAVEAITRHGAFAGLYLTVRRLLRCHPWHPGGIDEVPERFRWRAPRPDSDRHGESAGPGRRLRRYSTPQE
jgi:hypothetical protein